MSEAQKGICAEPNLHSLYLMFNAYDDVEPDIRLRLPKILDLLEDYDEAYSEALVSGFVAVGSNYWDTLYPDSRPAKLAPFPSFQSGDRTAPVIPYDIFVHIRADRFDVCHMIGIDVIKLLDSCMELVEQVKGFRYRDGRDLTGFVDGTENPKGMKKRTVALVGDEDPEFVAGSYIHVQRYRHNLKRWERLPQKDQEDIIGRTKDFNEEYTSENKQEFAHIKRTGLKDEDGNSIEILRQSMPYGTMKIQGLYFISCARDSANFTKMLKSMIFGNDAGVHDRLLDFTQAETGAAFFAPSVDFLQENSQ